MVLKMCLLRTMNVKDYINYVQSSPQFHPLKVTLKFLHTLSFDLSCRKTNPLACLPLFIIFRVTLYIPVQTQLHTFQRHFSLSGFVKK